jgi:hypothetical protein
LASFFSVWQLDSNKTNNKPTKDKKLGLTNMDFFTVMAEEHPPSPKREDDTLLSRRLTRFASSNREDLRVKPAMRV